MAVDVLAEVLSMQSGLSFAVSYARDPALSSGLMAEFLGLLAIALAFLLNIHLLVLDILLASFKVLPFGVWPTAWNLDALIGLVQDSFVLGLVLSLPAIAVYWLFNMTQSMLARVSPQMNLFSIGFSVMIPIAFVVIAFMLPQFPEIVQRALEEPVRLLRAGLEQRLP
jgi:flagellar biosynthetic protein FliR